MRMANPWLRPRFLQRQIGQHIASALLHQQFAKHIALTGVMQCLHQGLAHACCQSPRRSPAGSATISQNGGNAPPFISYQISRRALKLH